MDPIKTILVPVDFDAPSEAALEQAVRLARALGAKITLLHVVPFALSDVSAELFYAGPNTSIRQRTAAFRRLGEVIDRFGKDVEMKPEIREGITWDEIVGAATQHEADLIVIGTHGRHARLGLLGGVAERVVRASPVPVMTVRANVSPSERTEFAPFPRL